MRPDLTQVENFINGVGSKIFIIAEPVIVYGTVASERSMRGDLTSIGRSPRNPTVKYWDQGASSPLIPASLSKNSFLTD